MDLNIVGETAAIATSCIWTISSIFFTSAGKKIGSLGVNAYRTVMAVGFLVLTHMILLGSFLPVATSAQWFWMGLSGVIGLSIGDSGLFSLCSDWSPPVTSADGFGSNLRGCGRVPDAQGNHPSI